MAIYIGTSEIKKVYLGRGINIPSVVRLPTTYQEVEYIESTGTQYINTGYIPNANTEIEADISWGEGQLAWATFFGVTRNDSSSDGVLGRIFGGDLETFNPRFCNSSYDECQVSANVNAFNKITLKRNGGTINGTAFTVTTTGTPYSSSMDIFAGNSGGVHGWRASKCKIKTFKISESGTLKRNFVPCYRKSDNVVGMYDLVNSVFYTNGGTGEFLMGDYVKIKAVYKGDDRIFPLLNIPDSNTKYYVKGDGNITDYSGNITFSGRNISYSTEGSLTYIATKHDVNNGTAICNTSQRITLPLTFNMWLYVTSYWGDDTQYPRLLTGINDGESYSINLSSDNTGTYSVYGSGGEYPGMRGLSYGQWYNVCVTTDSTGLTKFYCDGELIQQGTPATSTANQLWMLARYTYRTDSFDGKASKLLYQNEVWDADTIKTWYNQTKSSYSVSGTKRASKSGKKKPTPFYFKPNEDASLEEKK